MSTHPIRKCAEAGCTTFTAHRYCSRHRRPAELRTISVAELSRRKREDLAQRDALHNEDDE